MKNKSLLAIDDDELILRLIRDVGENAGYEVVTVQDANYLDAALDGNDPTLIILDLVMPNFDGVEVLRILADRGTAARVLMISGFDATLLARARKLAEVWGLDVVGSVEKPLDVQKLSLAFKQIQALS
jgi:DNA-binding NtrC family response regulator